MVLSPARASSISIATPHPLTFLLGKSNFDFPAWQVKTDDGVSKLASVRRPWFGLLDADDHRVRPVSRRMSSPDSIGRSAAAAAFERHALAATADRSKLLAG